jgi:hypothetical protein
MGGTCSTNEEKNAYRILVGKPKGKRPLVRPRRRFEESIMMDLRWGGMDWIDLGLLNTVMNLRVP